MIGKNKYNLRERSRKNIDRLVEKCRSESSDSSSSDDDYSPSNSSKCGIDETISDSSGDKSSNHIFTRKRVFQIKSDDEDQGVSTKKYRIESEDEDCIRTTTITVKSKDGKFSKFEVDSSSEGESEKPEDEDLGDEKDEKPEDGESGGGDSDSSSEGPSFYDLSNKICESIISCVRNERSISDIDEKKLRDAITKCLEKEDNELSDEDSIDLSWQKGLSNENIKMYTKEIKRMKNEAISKYLTIPEILDANIPDESKIKFLSFLKELRELEDGEYEKNTEHKSLRKLFQKEKNKFLDEKMKLETEKLDETEKNIASLSSYTSDLDEMKKQIFNLEADEKIKSIIYEKFMEFRNMDSQNSTYNHAKEWLNWVLKLPYRKMIQRDNELDKNSSAYINDYCYRMRESLNEKLYGMNKVKERIVENLVQRISNRNSKSGMITLVSKPGCGKTAICSQMAKAMGVPFERIALGGMVDSSIFKGSDGSWLGSGPSIILRVLAKMKCSNGIILFDELDKLGVDSPKAQEVQNALLHITDYTQNNEFHDLYITEFTHDISNVWFMFAANDESAIDPVLRDRLDIIHIDEYTYNDKIRIVADYILPKALQNSGMNARDVKFGEDAVKYIILHGPSSKNPGIRGIERAVFSIISKINTLKNLTLPDGTTGKISMSYKINNLKFPFTVNSDCARDLLERDKIPNDKEEWRNGYV